MRWPLVWRSTADQLRADSHALNRELEDTRRLLVANQMLAQRHVDETRRLTDIIVDLKREGYNPSPKPDVLTSNEPQLPDVVIKAIRDRAQPNTELWRQLVSGAHGALQRDDDGGAMNAEDVARLIYVGGEPEEAE